MLQGQSEADFVYMKIKSVSIPPMLRAGLSKPFATKATFGERKISKGWQSLLFLFLFYNVKF